MLSHTQGPSLPLPAHNLRSSSPCISPIRSSRPFQHSGVTVSPLTERHEVEGLEEAYAGGNWVSWRFGSIWPTCSRAEGEFEDAQQYRRSIETLRSGPHAPALPYPHVNSVQPTFYPPMIIATAKPENEAERIRGGCLPCPQGWITSVTPQGKEPGISIDTSRPTYSPRPNHAPQSEKTETRAGLEGQGERARTRSEVRPTQSKTPARALHQSGQVPESRSRRGSQATMAERAPIPHYPLQLAAPSRALSQTTMYSDAATDPRSRVSSVAPLIRSRVASVGLPAEPPQARGRKSSQFLTPATPALPSSSQQYPFPKYETGQLVTRGWDPHS